MLGLPRANRRHPILALPKLANLLIAGEEVYKAMLSAMRGAAVHLCLQSDQQAFDPAVEFFFSC